MAALARRGQTRESGFKRGCKDAEAWKFWEFRFKGWMLRVETLASRYMLTKTKTFLFQGFLGLLIILPFTGCNGGGSSAAFDPAKIKSVVLYDIDPTQSQNYAEQIAKVTSYQLKPEEVQSLFAHTEAESPAVWKAAFLGVVQFQDGKESHLAISTFGAFVRVLATGKDMRFYDASRVEYERLKGDVLRNIFISQKQTRNQRNAK